MYLIVKLNGLSNVTNTVEVKLKTWFKWNVIYDGVKVQ